MGIFRKIFELGVAATEQRLGSEELAEYRAALGEVEKASATELPKALTRLPPTALVNTHQVRSLNASALRTIAASMLADGVLSEADENAFFAATEALGVDDRRMVSEFSDLADEILIARANDGRLMSIPDSGITLRRNEVAHAMMAAELLKEVTVREYRGGYGGYSFKIAAGVRYHAGRTRGKSVVVGSRIEVADRGTLHATSERAVFLGSKRSLEFAYPKLLEVGVYPDGLRLAVSNRKTPSVFKLYGNGEVMAAVINAAASRL